MGKFSALAGERNYFKRFFANAATRFADSIDQLVFSWVMYEVTGQASLAAIFLFFNFLPSILFQPFLGVLIERMQKKRAIIFCDLGRAAVVVFTLVAYLLGFLNAAWLIGLTLVISTLEAVNRPANSSFLPFLLGEDKYETGIALDSSAARIAELVGTGVAGIIISMFGVVGALVVDIAFFAISAIITGTIKGREEIEAAKLNVRSYFAQLGEGFKLLKSLKTVCLFMVLAAFANFFFSPLNAFQSAYVVDSLFLGPEMLSIIGVAITLGLGAGSAVAPRVRAGRSIRSIMLVVGIMQAASMLGYWIIPQIHASILRAALITLASLVFGLSVGVFSVISSTKIVSGIPKNYLARVMSVSSAVSMLMIPLGALICSGLALVMSVPAIFFIFGVFMLVFYAAVSRLKVLDGP